MCHYNMLVRTTILILWLMLSQALAEQLVWINEFHYNNKGEDSNEKIEIAHRIPISGYKVILYNGKDGMSYNTTTVSSEISPSSIVNGISYTVLPIRNIQNGGTNPDGIALIDDKNQVVQFLSYDGTFTAFNGAANGAVSIDIGIVETDNVSENDSLQLNPDTNIWEGPKQNTFGAPNSVIPVVPISDAPIHISKPINSSIPTTFIHDIQRRRSSNTTSYIVNVSAIVTSLLFRDDVTSWFSIQEEDIDADLDTSTSEGIYINCIDTCPLVTVGDFITVVGVVTQSYSTTVINASNHDIDIISSRNVVPTPIVLSLPALGSTELFSTYQNIEAMLVTFNSTLVISDAYNLAKFGELVLTESSVPFTFTQNNRPSKAEFMKYETLLSTRRIILDDSSTDIYDAITNSANSSDEPYFYPIGGLSISNKFRYGDSIVGLTGVLQYAFNKWRIRPVTQIFKYTITKTNYEPMRPENVGGTLRITSYNVLNYFTTLNNENKCPKEGDPRGANTYLELQKQSAKIVSALNTIDPDIAGLLELENSSSDSSVAALVNALNDIQGQGTYAYIPTGRIGTDSITVGLIYKPRAVRPMNRFRILDSTISPNFKDALNRPVLTQTFQQISTGQKFTISVCHLKSKGSSCRDDPDKSDGQGNCAQTRKKAAIEIAKFLATDPTSSDDPDHLIIGDLNAYAKEEAITELEKAGFVNLIQYFGGNNAYSYVYKGERGYLDHGLASSSLLSQVTNVTEWHINADEIPLFDYNDDIASNGEYQGKQCEDNSDNLERRKSKSLPLYSANPFRSSDHDPIIMGLSLNSNERGDMPDEL